MLSGATDHIFDIQYLIKFNFCMSCIVRKPVSAMEYVFTISLSLEILVVQICDVVVTR